MDSEMDSTRLLILFLLKLISGERDGRFSSLDGVRVGNVYKTVTIPENSMIFCSSLCLSVQQCISANFNNVSCELSLSHPNISDSSLTVADGWTVLYMTNALKADWEIVFRGTAKIGIDVATSFVGSNADTLPVPDPGCYSREIVDCNTHVRSPIIADWENLKIKEVKVEFVKNGQTVAYIIFKNRETDNMITWFRQENILSSSWTDLPSVTSTYPHFQLERMTLMDVSRSFYVNHKYIGCSMDEGWMFVAEQSGIHHCSYEQHSGGYPLFIYTTGSTVQVWDTAYGIADTMLISIKA